MGDVLGDNVFPLVVQKAETYDSERKLFKIMLSKSSYKQMTLMRFQAEGFTYVQRREYYVINPYAH